MRTLIKKIYWAIMSLLPDAVAVPLGYLRTFKRLPNLRHPKTFNEKLAWRKLNQVDPNFTVFADKIAVKSKVSDLLGEEFVIKTLWTGSRPEHIPYSNLKPPYVIKVSHSSGGPIFVNSQADVDRRRFANNLRKQLRHRHWKLHRERGYQKIVPRIIIEEKLALPGGAIPEDYKFFVYHGRVEFVQVDYDRFEDHRRVMYNRAFEPLDVQYCYPGIDTPRPQPAQFAEMISAAEKIGGIFDFCRVDLYATDRGIKFGEVTFYPEAGLGRS